MKRARTEILETPGRLVPRLRVRLGLAVLGVASWIVAGCVAAPRAPLVFAAASLADVLEEARDASDLDVAFHFAGSNELVRQILAAGPRDAPGAAAGARLFLSANRQQMDRLVAAGRVEADAVIPIARNTLAVVVPHDAEAPGTWREALLGAERVVLADPEVVPAGVYARQWLEREGLYSEIAERVVAALDVRAALHAVASGAAEIGVVYVTDAASTDRVRVLYEVSSDSAPAVRYFAALLPLRDGSNDAVAAGFLDYLRSEGAAPIWQRHGFRVGEGSSAP